MRLLRITTLYPSYIDAFYRGHPGLAREPYAVQRSRLDEDFFGWADSWSFALAPLGWETQDVAMNAALLPHAFDPRVAERLPDLPPRWDASFIAQLVEGAGFHGGRLRLLAEVATRVPIELFVPRPPRTWRSRIRRAVSALTGRRKGAPVPPAIAAAHDGVYGLAMYQVLRESRAALNIHADSSPRFASNMRLFEATGVGTCLVTDWKENIGALFEPDREVLTYRDASECA